MQVTTSKVEGGKTELTITLEREALERATRRVYREVGQRAKVPGFRPGKVPQAILERLIEPEAAREQAIEDLLDEYYPKALEQAGIHPLEPGEFSSHEVQEDGSVVLKATVTARPEVRLGQYKGLQLVRRRIPVTDEQVEAEIARMGLRYGTYRPVADRPIRPGDLVVVDYDMYLGDQKLEGRSVQGYPLEVGADRIFPELNEALEGAGSGQEVRFEVTYPADLSDPELAGKTVEVRATPKNIQERVSLSPEEVASRMGVADAEALRTAVREALESMAEEAAHRDLDEEAVRKAMEGSYVDPPEVMVQQEFERRIQEAEQEATRQGGQLDDILRRQGADPEEWRREQMIAASNEVKRALILDAIGRAENVQVSEEEIEAQVAALAESEGQPVAQVRRRLQSSGGLRRLANRLYNHKIMHVIVDNAQVTDEPVPAAEQEIPGEEPKAQEEQPRAE